MNFEIFGTNDILADVELILLADSILKNILPNQKFNLHINSLGDRDTLKSFKSKLTTQLCNPACTSFTYAPV